MNLIKLSNKSVENGNSLSIYTWIEFGISNNHSTLRSIL